MPKEISNSDDLIDVRDLIDHFEELELEIDGDEDHLGAEEYNTLKSFLADLKGNGGDHQWHGDWYPLMLIRDSYFTEAMQEHVEDIGDMKGIPSYLEIDWEATARNLQADYSSVEFDGVTYWSSP